MVRIVVGVSQDDGGLIVRRESSGLWRIALLAAGQHDPGRAAKAAHGQVHLRARAAARSPQGLIFSPFFAPAAC